MTLSQDPMKDFRRDNPDTRFGLWGARVDGPGMTSLGQALEYLKSDSSRVSSLMTGDAVYYSLAPEEEDGSRVLFSHIALREEEWHLESDSSKDSRL